MADTHPLLVQRMGYHLPWRVVAGVIRAVFASRRLGQPHELHDLVSIAERVLAARALCDGDDGAEVEIPDVRLVAEQLSGGRDRSGEAQVDGNASKVIDGVAIIDRPRDEVRLV